MSELGASQYFSKELQARSSKHLRYPTVRPKKKDGGQCGRADDIMLRVKENEEVKRDVRDK